MHLRTEGAHWSRWSISLKSATADMACPFCGFMGHSCFQSRQPGFLFTPTPAPISFARFHPGKWVEFVEPGDLSQCRTPPPRAGRRNSRWNFVEPGVSEHEFIEG